MKHSLCKAIGVAMFVFGSLHVFSGPTASAAQASPPAAIPATSAGIWHAIDARSAELKKLIDAGKLADVHHQAFAIRDLVAALPGHSASLSADKLAKVRSGAKFVATLAARLDATGDAKDLAGTKSNFAKLATVLASLRANYPPALQGAPAHR